MEQIIFYTITSFILGFFLGAIIFKKKTSENMLFSTLAELRKSLDEYKNQNELNTKEVKEAIKDASKLTKILTTNQNIKGQFGENCLENIIKTCYPKENIDYIKQYQDKNQDDKTIRPDFLIKLPNDKSILIDCKVKLEKYIEYKENQDETISQEKKSEFIKDINATINNLSNKNYQNALNANQPDFILMYILLFLNVVENSTIKTTRVTIY